MVRYWSAIEAHILDEAGIAKRAVPASSLFCRSIIGRWKAATADPGIGEEGRAGEESSQIE